MSSCKAQDVLVALKLLTIGEEPWSFTRLAQSLHISLGATYNAITHLRAAQLVYERRGLAMVAKKRFVDFLVHGVPVVFYPERGGITHGIPTGTMAPVLNKIVPAGAKKQELPAVWPSPGGKVKGESLQPLYKTAPQAALSDPNLYVLLALVDSVRAGPDKDRGVCVDALYAAIVGTDDAAAVAAD